MNSLDKYINTILSLLEGAKKREIDLYGLNIVVRHYQDHTPVPLSNLARERVEMLLGYSLETIKRTRSHNGNPSMLQLNTKAKQQYGISTLLMYEHIMEVKKDILPALMSIENPTYENVKETIDDLTRIVIKLKNEEGKLKGRNAEKLLVD
jgi:hypothetical protein